MGLIFKTFPFSLEAALTALCQPLVWISVLCRSCSGDAWSVWCDGSSSLLLFFHQNKYSVLGIS